MSADFNEVSLRNQIEQTWGEKGMHIYVFDEMQKQTASLREENEKLKQSLSTSERFRAEDALSANKELASAKQKIERLRGLVEQSECKYISLLNKNNKA